MKKQFRKKPVVINAEQFAIFDRNKVYTTLDICGVRWPVYKHVDKDAFYIEIPTLEGVMRCNELDWIIEGVNGEYYPCKPDIFAKTYEAA